MKGNYMLDWKYTIILKHNPSPMDAKYKDFKFELINDVGKFVLYFLKYDNCIMIWWFDTEEEAKEHAEKVITAMYPEKEN